ncbi:hypothetical protein KKG36_03165 [Patescibacteria group bacterium]|nr:hypothetical protein [Patescibacteria group bacterium]
MLEMIVAIFILAVAIIGCYYAFVQISSATALISSRLQAAYLAHEAFEIVRNMRDSNWLSGEEWGEGFLTICAVGCQLDYKAGTYEADDTSLGYDIDDYLNLSADGFYTYAIEGTPTKFKRKVTVSSTEDHLFKVSVLIEWYELNAERELFAEEELYDWY